MAPTALFIRHRTQPGRRDQVRAVWDRHVRAAVARNPGHAAYFYCFDDGDPDAICAFQQYVDADAARAFLATEGYAAYLRDVEPLLAGPPEVTSLTPVWTKGP
jgi:quinol monooxygenase YgiN